MNFFRRFMTGRNGPDALGHAALALAVVLTLVSYISPALWFLNILGYVALVYSIFRMISRGVYKRRAENQAFLKFFRRFGIGQKEPRPVNAKPVKYRVFACPSCKAQCRVPRGKGKVRITCKECSHVYEGKS